MGSSSALSGFWDINELTSDDRLEWVELTRLEQPSFARRFLSRVESLGGPIEFLDYSIGSLRPAWEWHVANARVERGETPDTPEDLAVWMRGAAGVFAARGLEYSWMATELAAYFFETLAANSTVRVVLSEQNRVPVLKGPSGYETAPGPFPMVPFASTIKTVAARDPLHLVRQALDLAGGFDGVPEPQYSLHRFDDEVIIEFPDDIAHRHEGVVVAAQELVLALDAVELRDGDRGRLVFAETAESSPPLHVRISLVLRQLDDPRFPPVPRLSG